MAESALEDRHHLFRAFNDCAEKLISDVRRLGCIVPVDAVDDIACCNCMTAEQDARTNSVTNSVTSSLSPLVYYLDIPTQPKELKDEDR